MGRRSYNLLSTLLSCLFLLLFSKDIFPRKQVPFLTKILPNVLNLATVRSIPAVLYAHHQHILSLLMYNRRTTDSHMITAAQLNLSSSMAVKRLIIQRRGTDGPLRLASRSPRHWMPCPRHQSMSTIVATVSTVVCVTPRIHCSPYDIQVESHDRTMILP